MTSLSSASFLSGILSPQKAVFQKESLHESCCLRHGLEGRRSLCGCKNLRLWKQALSVSGLKVGSARCSGQRKQTVQGPGGKREPCLRQTRTAGKRVCLGVRHVDRETGSSGIIRGLQRSGFITEALQEPWAVFRRWTVGNLTLPRWELTSDLCPWFPEVMSKPLECSAWWSTLAFLGASGQAGQQHWRGMGTLGQGPEWQRTDPLTHWRQEGGAALTPQAEDDRRFALGTFPGLCSSLGWFFLGGPQDLWDHGSPKQRLQCKCQVLTTALPGNCLIMFVFVVYLVYNVVLVSGVHESDSGVCVCLYLYLYSYLIRFFFRWISLTGYSPLPPHVTDFNFVLSLWWTITTSTAVVSDFC